MPTAIALIRGINVGGNNPLPMASLRALCENCGLADIRTYIQSGNIVFTAPARQIVAAARTLENAIESAHGFRPGIITRSLDEWHAAIADSPFASRGGIDPAKLHIMFLASKPAAPAAKALAGVKRGEEELHLIGRELHLYFPDGVGKSKLSMAAVEKALATPGTARNWNTILKLRELAATPA